jgi:uncharacterized protein (DUF169 family)
MDIEEIKRMAEAIISSLGLNTSPVGVKFLSEADIISEPVIELRQHRYCQALMKARRGQSVLLGAEGISCPGAAAAFGFKTLPEPLASGKGLVGFGIVSDEAVGRRMLEGMTRIKPGRVSKLHLFPLEKAQCLPDVVVVEAEVEQLMWIALAYLHATGGERVNGSTAVLQAACVDSTIIPYLENRLNYGFGCYGCRDATDIAPGEAVLGFPAHILPAIVKHLEFLAGKAIPNSRKKGAFAAIKRETCPSYDPVKEN